jgi:DNA-binding transcriptional MocR family regulator
MGSTTGEICELIASTLTGRGQRGLTEAVRALVEEGRLVPGDRLPSIRELAGHLQVSPTTVAAAWSHLAQSGVIVARGRRGSFVATTTRAAHATPRWRFSLEPASYDVDLSTGVPDPRLVVDPVRALASLEDPVITSYLEPPVHPRLRQTLVEYLAPELLAPGMALTVVDGALDAIDRILGAIELPGRAVIVEEPSFPALYDLVELHGFELRPVPIDEEGMRPDRLAAELARGRVEAVLVQPRAQNPTGVSLTRERRDRLAAVLAAYPTVLVIEDDHSGLIASTPLASLAAPLGTRVAYVLSFSKSHGPDLRLAAVAAEERLVAELERRRTLGPAWSPKLLQLALAASLGSPTEPERLASVAEAYGRRRARLGELLPIAPGTTGINAWVGLQAPLDIALHLAHSHIKVAPGTSFFLAGDRALAHLRVTLADPRHEFDWALARLGEALARIPAGSSYR